MKRTCIILLLCGLLSCASPLLADLSSSKIPVMSGENQSFIVTKNIDFFTLAQQYDVGYDALVAANAHVNPLDPAPGTLIIIPSQHLVPPETQYGMVINLAEKRLYYYDKDHGKLHTFPVGIGRQGWQSPQGAMRIIEKRHLPHWNVPQSIMELQASQGIILPESIPPGPVNPLGEYAMRLSNPSYLIHGTNYPKGIGRRVTSGCFQLYPNDIKTLFQTIPLKTRVIVINRPTKITSHANTVYVEHHQYLKDSEATATTYQDLKAQVSALTTRQTTSTLLRWILADHNGLVQSLSSTTQPS